MTPFRSMIKYATDMQLPLKTTMFNANRNQANILYKEEFDSWAKLNKNLKIIYIISEDEVLHFLSEWKGERGYIDKPMLARHLSKGEMGDSIFYIWVLLRC